MRYTKTVALWDHNTAHMVRTGQLKLQAGQWVKCGQEKPRVLSRLRTVALSSRLTLKTEAHIRDSKLCAKST